MDYDSINLFFFIKLGKPLKAGIFVENLIQPWDRNNLRISWRHEEKGKHGKEKEK